MLLTRVLFFYFFCADDRFPEYGKVEFIFSFGPEKINGESLQLTCAGEHVYCCSIWLIPSFLMHLNRQYSAMQAGRRRQKHVVNVSLA